MYCPYCGTFNEKVGEVCTNCKRALPVLDPNGQPVWPLPPEQNNPEATPPLPPGQSPTENTGVVHPVQAPRPDFYPGLPGSQYNFAPAPLAYPPPSTPVLPPSPPEGWPGQGSGWGRSNFAPNPGYPGSAAAYAYNVDRVGVARHDAGFWVRLGAWLIDRIITGAVSFIIVGIPLFAYGGSFISKYGNEITKNCPNGTRSGYYSNRAAAELCNTTMNSILFDRHELSSFLGIIFGFGAISWLLITAYFVIMTAYGATIGKRVFGLKVVKEDGTPPGFGRSLLRMTVGYWISTLIFYLGFVWIALDEQKQGWHDKIARTFVVRI